MAVPKLNALRRPHHPLLALRSLTSPLIWTPTAQVVRHPKLGMKITRAGLFDDDASSVDGFDIDGLDGPLTA
jgi:hypothetical protein